MWAHHLALRSLVVFIAVVCKLAVGEGGGGEAEMAAVAAVVVNDGGGGERKAAGKGVKGLAKKKQRCAERGRDL